MPGDPDVTEIISPENGHVRLSWYDIYNVVSINGITGLVHPKSNKISQIYKM